MDKEKIKEKTKIRVILLIIITCLVFMATAAIMFSCSMMKNYPPDNIVEEVGEEVLDHYTGVDVDFTPWSPEEH